MAQNQKYISPKDKAADLIEELGEIGAYFAVQEIIRFPYTDPETKSYWIKVFNEINKNDK